MLPTLWAAYQQGGKLPWADLIQPAIRLAERGVIVSRDLVNALRVKNEYGYDASASLW